MKELKLCNYYGMCDEYGKSVGHTVKVTNEYAQLLRKHYVLSLYASPTIIQAVDHSLYKEIIKLKYNIDVSRNGIFKRICDKFKLIINISQILKGDGCFFFYQVDFFFFFYIYFLYKMHDSKKVYCLVFHQNFTGGIFEKVLRNIYYGALSKIDGIIYTQTNQEIKHGNTLWMPDFFYDDKIYQRFLRLKKENSYVCIGTMNRYKQLEELVDCFSKVNYPLLIVGRFDDKKRFHSLVKKKTDNIEIQDRNIPYDEYLKILGSSKFSIIPYDMSQYVNRTSGVLLESIYVGSIPIAPNLLLEQNSLPGIGYENMDEIFDEKNQEFDVTEFDIIRKQNDQKYFNEKLDSWFY